MKLNEKIEKGEIKETEAKAGYVGAFPYAEVIPGYTAFYLGVLSVCDSATMTVRYTNSWHDEEEEMIIERKKEGKMKKSMMMEMKNSFNLILFKINS